MAILAYAAKTASAFYGPFRDAAGSAPSFGDRRGYQMDPANAARHARDGGRPRRGRRHAAGQARDAVTGHPRRARANFDVPIGAYQVSGEYAVIKAAAATAGWTAGARYGESTTSILRAGAGFVITYAAADLAAWAREAW